MSCQKPGLLIPTHQPGVRPDEFGQTMARPSRLDPGLFCKVWPMLSLEKTELKSMREVGSGIYKILPNSGFTLATTGHDQNASGSDPACLLG